MDDLQTLGTLLTGGPSPPSSAGPSTRASPNPTPGEWQVALDARTIAVILAGRRRQQKEKAAAGDGWTCRVLQTNEEVIFVTAWQMAGDSAQLQRARGDGYRVVVVPEEIERSLVGLTDLNGRPLVDVDKYRSEWNDPARRCRDRPRRRASLRCRRRAAALETAPVWVSVVFRCDADATAASHQAHNALPRSPHPSGHRANIGRPAAPQDRVICEKAQVRRPNRRVRRQGLEPRTRGLRARFILLYEVSGCTGHYRGVPVRAGHS